MELFDANHRHRTTLFSWLFEEAAASVETVPVPGFHGFVLHEFRNMFERDGAVSGLDLEQWEPIMTASIDAFTASDGLVPLPRPLAAFLYDLLADLAYRGSRGRVSQAQAALMLIGSMNLSGWALVDADGSQPRITLATAQALKLNIAVDVMLRPDDVADLHYSIG